MLRPAHAVEYDYLPATQCYPTLMTKRIEGLFCAGQINALPATKRQLPKALSQVLTPRYARHQEMIVFPRATSGRWLTVYKDHGAFTEC